MFIPVGTEEMTPRGRFLVVTVALVVINSLMFLFEVFFLFSGGEQALNTFITAFGVIPAAVTSGQSLILPLFLTLFTSMFVHGSLTHISFNMLYLLAFGDNVEDRLGRWRFLIFYLLSGLLATVAHILSDPTSPVPTVGASGRSLAYWRGISCSFPKAGYGCSSSWGR